MPCVGRSQEAGLDWGGAGAEASVAVLSGLWKQTPELGGKLGEGVCFQKGTQKVWFGHQLRPDYSFPLLGLEFGPDISQLQIKLSPCKFPLALAQYSRMNTGRGA